MTNEAKQKIKEKLGFLPKEMQEAINSLDWVVATEEIGKKYLLNEDEINNLQTETFLVLAGLEKGEAYAKNIENEVGIGREEAEKIADDAEEKIFSPIYDALQENIKKGIKTKNPNWEQSLDFILSNGDYSAFMDKRDDMINTTPASPLSGGTATPRPDKGEAGRGF